MPKLDLALSSPVMNLVLRTGYHDPLFGRIIETLKGKACSCIYVQSYRVFKITLILMVLFITYCANLVSTRRTDGVDSFKENLTGKKISLSDIPTVFGSYNEITFAKSDNSMNEQTNSCITMGLDKSRFYKLSMGRLIHHVSYPNS